MKQTPSRNGNHIDLLGKEVEVDYRMVRYVVGTQRHCSPGCWPEQRDYDGQVTIFFWRLNVRLKRRRKA
jgi:hypothetical protein